MGGDSALEEHDRGGAARMGQRVRRTRRGGGGCLLVGLRRSACRRWEWAPEVKHLTPALSPQSSLPTGRSRLNGACGTPPSRATACCCCPVAGSAPP